MQARMAAVMVALTLWSAPLQAQHDLSDVDPELADLAYLGLTLPIGQMLAFTEPSTSDRAMRPSALDLRVRQSLMWDNPQPARNTADVFLFTLTGAMVLAPFVGNLDVSGDSWNGALVGLEAYATATLVMGLSKHIVMRQRPGGAEAHTYDLNASFISGHTALTFSGATMLTAFAYDYEWLDERVRWVIPTTAFTAAALTGYLRIAGNNHWLTDVVAGALVGMGATYLVYHVRVR